MKCRVLPHDIQNVSWSQWRLSSTPSVLCLAPYTVEVWVGNVLDQHCQWSEAAQTSSSCDLCQLQGYSLTESFV